MRGWRSACPACRIWSRRWPTAATTSSTSPPPGRRASPRLCSAGSPGCRCSPATTPSWPPTPACAAATAASRQSPATALGAFYGAPGVVLSPSPAADASLVGLGTDPARIGRWERGVDTDRFDPVKADRDAYPGEIKVLYAGRLTREKGVDLLAESFLRARDADPRLHLLLAGGGPEEDELRARLGDARDLPRLARWRGSGLRLRQRRRLPLRQQHRHLRPGDPRGRRERAAGGRGRRGRPGGADREPPHRPALPPRPRPFGGRPAAACLLAGPAPPARRRRRQRRPRPLLGAGAGPARGGYRRALEARRRQPRSHWPRSPEAGGHAGSASVRWIDRRSRSLFQPRALLARLQPAGPRTGGGHRGAAAGAAPLLRHLRLQPRRVLHGPSRRPLRPARRRDRRPRPRRPRPERADRRDPGAGAGAGPPPPLLLRRHPAAGAGGGGGPHRHPRHAPARRSGGKSTPASTSRSSRR